MCLCIYYANCYVEKIIVKRRRRRRVVDPRQFARRDAWWTVVLSTWNSKTLWLLFARVTGAHGEDALNLFVVHIEFTFWKKNSTIQLWFPDAVVFRVTIVSWDRKSKGSKRRRRARRKQLLSIARNRRSNANRVDVFRKSHCMQNRENALKYNARLKSPIAMRPNKSTIQSCRINPRFFGSKCKRTKLPLVRSFGPRESWAPSKIFFFWRPVYGF